MKKIFLIFLFSLFIATSVIGKEEFKTVTVPELDFELTLPEKAPDIRKFKGQLVGMNIITSDTRLAYYEGMNEDYTVSIVIVFVLKKNSVNVIGMQVTYCPIGLHKVGATKDIEKQFNTEFFEDTTFMKSGKLTNKLERVEKFNNTDITRWLK